MRNERRRPDRGERSEAPARRTRRPLGGVFGAIGRAAAFLLLVPLQLLLMLARPVQLARRLSEAPGRMQARTRRLRMEARDPETTAGRIRVSAEMTGHFFREELADMEDGFPKAEDVLADLRSLIRRAALRAGRTLGLVDERGDSDEVFERLFRASALGLIVAGVGVGLFASTFLAIDEFRQHERLSLADIQVVGHHRLAGDVVQAAGTARLGDNLMDLDLDAIAARVEELPWVERALPERDLRSQTLVLRVVERRPALILADGGLQLIDDRGVAFKPLERGDATDLPILAIEGSSSPEAVAEATRGALQILQAASAGTALRDRDISELRWEASRGYTLVTRAGLPIRVGREDFAARLGRLERAASSGGLLLDHLAELDLALRDRIVAVPRTQPKARKQLAKRIAEQPVKADARTLMLHLQRVQTDDADLFGGAQ